MFRAAIARPLASCSRLVMPQSARLSAAPVARLSASLLVRTLVTKKYSKEHEYVIFDSDSSVATLGITDYAQKALGDVVYVELPEVLSKVSAGDAIGAVESVKAASDIFAPVSGEVQEVNEALDDTPGLLNQSPEEDGWLAKIKLSDPKEVDEMLSEEDYKKFCEGEES